MPYTQILKKWLLIGNLTVLMGCQTLTGSTPETSTANHSANKNTTDTLTLDDIYTEHKFRSDTIGRIRWLSDGSAYTVIEDSKATKQNKQGDFVSIGKDINQFNPKTLAKTTLVKAKQLMPEHSNKPLRIDDYIWSTDRSKVLIYTNSKKVWRSNSRGDYWVLNLVTNELKPLGGQYAHTSKLMFAKFSPAGDKVAYVVNNNIYVETLANGDIKQLTFDAGNGIINGLFDWVYEEEFSIRDGFRWSPDGKHIAYWQLDTSGSKNFTLINNTDTLYPTLTTFPYPKVGEQNALAKIGVVNVASATTVWAKLKNNSRNMYIPRMNWSLHNDEILIQHVNRKQDTNHLYLTNINTGNSREILTEQEPNFLDNFTDVRWLNKGDNFIWTSERSGWRKYYLVSRDGKQMTNLTPGEFDVVSLSAIDEKNGWLYYIASPKDVSQRYLFRSKLDGSITNEQVTPAKFSGFNRYQMSPNGQWAIHSFSNFNTPTQTWLINVNGHVQKKQLLTNKALREKLVNLSNKASTEFFKVTAQDGVVLDGYIMRPADFDPSKKYPIIFYVYGEAWGQTVQDRWRGSSYLWDQMMTQKGFLIASIDNRGTRAPKGQQWRKSIYGAVGVLSSRDQSDALKAMAKRWSYIDTNRVGIWGHSGGGSMTLNMLFRYPEQYKTGIAIAPVADQRLYDTIYQERYSGLLPDHEQGYKIGSPITYAKNLKGNLLLVHGTGDDNVHYQGTERLINELVRYNKQFDFMSYPNRTHSLREGKGTTLHLKTMMANYFLNHLQSK